MSQTTPRANSPQSKKAVAAHKYEKDPHEHYVEEEWVPYRICEVEKMPGDFVVDPSCGWGRMLMGARALGHEVRGADIVDRSPYRASFPFKRMDFLEPHTDREWQWYMGGSFLCNPPFKLLRHFVTRALSLTVTGRKVVMVFPVRQWVASRWMRFTPMRRVWLLTPRPSMPTGDFILAASRGEVDPITGRKLKVERSSVSSTAS